MRRRGFLWALVTMATALTVVAVSSPAATQTSGPVASGDFTGTIAIDGGFGVDVAQFVPGATGAVVVLVDGSGPLEVTLDEGQMTGTWTIAGTQEVRGNFGMTVEGVSANVVMSGEGTFDGAGEMGGPPSGYNLSGSVTSTNTATVRVVGITEQSATTTETTQIQQTLTDVAVLCQQIYGRWDLEIRQQIQDIGFNEFIRGYFSASTGVDATEQAEELETIIDNITEWVSGTGGFSAASAPDDVLVAEGLAILDLVQEKQAELAAPTPCPPDPTFATELTLAAQDVIATLLARTPGVTDTDVVALGLGSGAIGAGSPSPERAAELEAQLEADVQQKWDEQVENYPETTTEAELVETARTAQMLGMETLGEISPGDVILTITGESS